MNSKSIFLSKTFWLNIMGTAIMVAGVIPQKYGIPILGVLNILNRFLTNTDVHIVPPSNTP